MSVDTLKAKFRRWITNIPCVLRQGVTVADRLKVVLYLSTVAVFKILQKLFPGSFNRVPVPYSCVVQLHGFKYFARRFSDDLYHVLCIFEPETTRTILELSKKSGRGVFIDVGAHIGRYSILVGGVLGKNGTVFAVEPFPETVDSLKKNIALNKLTNIVVLPVALGNKSAIQNLYINSISSGAHSLVRKGSQKISVPVERLDSILKKYRISPEDVFLVKIDVEGAERLVLEGAVELLENGSPVIIFEAWDEERLRRCKEIFDKFGYAVEHIEGDNYIARKINNVRG